MHRNIKKNSRDKKLRKKNKNRKDSNKHDKNNGNNRNKHNSLTGFLCAYIVLFFLSEFVAIDTQL